MTSAEIRQSFFDFFKEKGHEIVPSASLLPTAPNLLFTNAGMNQFVPYFLGESQAPHPRIADTQKCIRAGGKHNDLEDVGFDTYHHTFFEMLGNWSFGDYFKKEAIAWAWELLTQVWGFPKERLYVTVYDPEPGEPASFDQEAWNIWEELLKSEGLDPAVHIKAFGKKDNFWMMGDTGPCGPCSEISIDLTEKNDTQGSLVNADSPYCIEIWNLVFIQFNAEANGSYSPLAAKHIDTGMGFDRIAGILATTNNCKEFGKLPSNYNSDLFTDIFKHLTEMSGHTYQFTLPEDRNVLSEVEVKDCAFRILADHARTLSCSIADGIIPGNEGRNYVLRRILRRAVLWAGRIKLPNGSFVKLVDPVVDKLGPVFPELVEQRDIIRRVIASEEDAFEKTIDRGLQLLEKIAEDSSGMISGKDAFTLYDTYGFPIDLTQIVAREKNLQVDLAGFENEMEQQRQRARAAQKKSVIEVTESEEDVKKTEFDGYDRSHLSGFEAEVEDVVQTGDKNFLVFNRTPFYAEMGGQVGDTGIASIDGHKVKILDTIKDGAGRYLHQVKDTGETDLSGKHATLNVDQERRFAIQRHHSGTHILHWAMRKVLGNHVKQAGSLVEDNRLRFDFTHFEQPTPEQLNEIERLTNERILENAGVHWYETPFDEKPKEVIAFFGEKYGKIVRVVDIGGWSVELCGGTHVDATGEIGLMKVVSESAIAAGTRRIEAVAGESAYDLMRSNAVLLDKLSRQLSCQPRELENRLSSLLDQQKSLEKELRGQRQKDASALADELAGAAKKSGDLSWVAAQVEVDSPDSMRKLAVQVAKKTGPGVVALGGVFGEKVTVLALCSPEAVEAGHRAGDIVKKLAGEVGGRGGGKPDFAMGGGNQPDKLEDALKSVLP